MSGNFGMKGASSGSLNNRNPRPRIERLDTGYDGHNIHIPVTTWPDAILDGAGPDRKKIRFAFLAGANLLNQGGDIGKNIRAFNSLEFAVSNELFLTPTARYCDVIFPAASPLQKEDIGIPWDGNYLLYKPKILPFEGQERSDYDIFSELSYLMGKGEAFSLGRTESQWIDVFLKNSEIEDIDTFKSSGFYIAPRKKLRNFELFSTNPAMNPIGTESGKLEFGGSSCTRWKKQCMPLKDGKEPLSLITPKKHDRVHSQGGDFGEKIYENELLINPKSAMEWGFNDGELAIIRSIHGTAQAKLRYSLTIRPGVVSLFEGSWYDQAKGKNSPNLLTPSIGTEESQSCIMHGIPVYLEFLEP
jgi:anaerobic selenocysteine-containing dehydrogenase